MNLSAHRWLVVAAAHALALFAADQINHYLSPLATRATVIGMLVAFSALHLGFRQGLLSLLVVALLHDSKAPWTFGTSLPVALVLFAATFAIRHRIRRETALACIGTSAVVNALAYLAFLLAAYLAFGSGQLGAGLVFWNLFASSLVVVLCARPYFSLLFSFLALAGIHLAEEQRQTR